MKKTVFDFYSLFEQFCSYRGAFLTPKYDSPYPKASRNMKTSNNEYMVCMLQGCFLS